MGFLHYTLTSPVASRKEITNGNRFNGLRERVGSHSGLTVLRLIDLVTKDLCSLLATSRLQRLASSLFACLRRLQQVIFHSFPQVGELGTIVVA